MVMVDEEALRSAAASTLAHHTEEGRSQQLQQPHGSNDFLTLPASNSSDNQGMRKSNSHSLLTPPVSGSYRLPLKMHDIQKLKPEQPLLLHPFLHRIPLHIRFGLNGFLSNLLFMVAYNEAIVKFDQLATASTIYSITYLFFIPVSHAFLSILVFGWPKRYIPSLMSNTPIGITAIVLGAVLTEYLDEMKFNKSAVDTIAQNWAYFGYEVEPTSEEEKGEFYSSLLVLFVTGLWTFFLSIFVNSASEATHKKEL